MVDFERIANGIENGYRAEGATAFERDFTLPDLKEVLQVIADVRKLFFPAYFSACEAQGEPANFARPLLGTIYYRLKKQVGLVTVQFQKFVRITTRKASLFVRAVSRVMRKWLIKQLAIFFLSSKNMHLLKKLSLRLIVLQMRIATAI